MRAFQIILPLFLWVSSGLARSPELASAIDSLPHRAALCFANSIEASTREVTNVTYLCTDAALQASIQTCLLSTCTLRETLTTKNFTSTLCNAPIRDDSESSRITNIAMPVISSSLGLLRVVYNTFFARGEMGWDDYTMIMLLLVGVPSVIIIDKGALPNGLGRDVWTVPFDHITAFVHWLYALEILYFLQIALLKLTLLFFFLRIFPQRTVKRVLWTTIIMVAVWATIFIFLAIFQCQPIAHYWLSWDKQHEGTCININALGWTNAAISITLDVWMLALPLWEVFHLQLTLRKKLSVAIMFCVGTFVTIVSCLRLRSLLSFATSENPTWDQTDVINWSNIEINVGIICACMPALRVMLARLFPAAMGSTRKSTWGDSAMASKAARDIELGNPVAGGGVGTITYVKTWEIQRAEGDEVELVGGRGRGGRGAGVETDDFTGKYGHARSYTHSKSSSTTSIGRS